MQSDQQGQMLSKVPGQEKIFPDIVLRPLAYLRPHLLLVKQVTNAQGSTFRGMDQETGMVIDHLQADPAGIAPDDRFAFPHRLGYGQAETLFG